MSNHWEAEVKRLNSVVDTCLKYHNEDKARIAQLESQVVLEALMGSDLIMQIVKLKADLKVAQNYEDQHYQRCQQLEAALREARDLLVEWREGNAPFTQTDMWLSITAETPADAVDRISDEAMKNTKTYGW